MSKEHDKLVQFAKDYWAAVASARLTKNSEGFEAEHEFYSGCLAGMAMSWNTLFGVDTKQFLKDMDTLGLEIFAD